MDDAIIAEKVSEAALPQISEKAVIELRIQGLTCEEIGRHFGVTKQAISKRLKSAFRALDKDVKIILMSGYSEQEADLQVRDKTEFLSKPFNVAKVKATVSRVLGLED